MHVHYNGKICHLYMFHKDLSTEKLASLATASKRYTIAGLERVDWNGGTGIVESSIYPIWHFTNLECDPKRMHTCMNVNSRLACNIFALYACFCQTQYSQHSTYIHWLISNLLWPLHDSKQGQKQAYAETSISRSHVHVCMMRPMTFWYCWLKLWQSHWRFLQD